MVNDESLASIGDLSHNEQNVVERVCRDFEARWKAGDIPDVRSHMSGESGSSAIMEQVLFGELLGLDLDYRVKRRLPLDESIYGEWSERYSRITQRELRLARERLAADRESPTSRSDQLDARRTAFQSMLERRGNHGNNEPRPFGTLGDFELFEQLGSGGMEVVFRARQVTLNRLVALKLVRPEFAWDPNLVERLRSEAQLVAQLCDSRFVQVYSFDEVDHVCFYAMELVEGPNLEQFSRSQVLEPALAAQLMRDVAAAVQLVHSKGIVHRDLKPANILLDGENRPKIADFGLAFRPLADQDSTNAIVGTPGYLAPEQAALDRPHATIRSDVYSLGATLYRILCGRPPFVAGTQREMLELLRHTDPLPPGTLRSHLPRDLETIVMKCLRREPEKRYASAGEVADELQRFLENRPVIARPVSRRERVRRWCQRNPHVALLSVSLALVFLVGFTLSTTLAISNYVALQREQRSLRRAESTRNALKDLLSSPSPRGRGAETTIAELMPDWRRRLLEDRELAPADRIELLELWGQYALDQELSSHSVELWSDIVRLRRQAGSSDPEGLYRAQVKLAQAWNDASKCENALTLCQSLLDDPTSTERARWSDVVDCRSTLGMAFEGLKRLTEARHVYEQLLTDVRRQSGEESHKAIQMELVIASLLAEEHNFDASFARYEHWLPIAEKEFGRDDERLLTPKNNYANALLEANKAPLALEVLSDVEARRRRTHPPGSRVLLVTSSNLGLALANSGHLDRAIACLEEAASSLATDALHEKPEVGRLWHNLGYARLKQDRLDRRGIECLERADAILHGTLGPTHPSTLNNLNSLAVGLRRQDRARRALSIYERILSIANEPSPETSMGDRQEHARLQAEVAIAELDLGNIERAVDHAQRSWKLLRHEGDLLTLESFQSSNNVAHVYSVAGRPDDALTVWENLISRARRDLPKDSGLAEYGEICRAGERTHLAGTERAISELRELLARLSPPAPSGNPSAESEDARIARKLLVACLLNAGRPQEARETWHVSASDPLGTLSKDLNLSGAPIKDEGLAHLGPWQDIQVLNLSKTTLDGSGLTHLSQLANLEQLNLSRAFHLRPEAFRTLHSLKSLRSLTLDRCRVPGTWFSELPEGWGLRQLSLKGVNVDVEQLRALTRLPDLEELVLQDVSLSSSAVDALRRLPALRLLHWTDCDVRESDFRRLAALRPELRLEPPMADNSPRNSSPP